MVCKVEFLAPPPGQVPTSYTKNALVPDGANETKPCPVKMYVSHARSKRAFASRLLQPPGGLLLSPQPRHTPRVTGGRALAAGWPVYIHLRDRELKMVEEKKVDRMVEENS
jgi:hypothetical protein